MLTLTCPICSGMPSMIVGNGSEALVTVGDAETI